MQHKEKQSFSGSLKTFTFCVAPSASTRNQVERCLVEDSLQGQRLWASSWRHSFPPRILIDWSPIPGHYDENDEFETFFNEITLVSAAEYELQAAIRRHWRQNFTDITSGSQVQRTTPVTRAGDQARLASHCRSGPISCGTVRVPALASRRMALVHSALLPGFYGQGIKYPK